MRRFGWILVVLTMAAPAWAAKKLSVEQLQDLLHSLRQANKTDAEVATELQQIELTEELTKSTIDSLASFVPGPLTTDQIYVLEARSAVLAPPAADLPSTPAPDAAAQKALLDKAVDYATKTYAQLPHLTATKTTFRFQDVPNPPNAANQGKPAGKTEPGSASGGTSIFYVGQTVTQVESQSGAEILSKVKDPTPWGVNGQIALLGQGPVLSTVVQQAQAAGKIAWLRWETVYGRQTAVFSFAVDKKKSHYAVNYCCFPNTDQARLNMVNQNVQPGFSGNIQAVTDWSPFKATAPYHGELFVDAQTGIVVRLVTEAEFKPYETVHQENTCIDYGTVTVGGNPLVLPVRTLIATEVIPSGGESTGKRPTLRTLFTIEYKDFKPAS
jgi:hypothetical protein